MKAAGVLDIDLGGGAFGSAGHNSIFLNTGNDIRVNYIGGGSVFARDNYWGGGALSRSQVNAAATLDASGFLTTDPNP